MNSKLSTSTCRNETNQLLTIDMTEDKFTGRYRLGLNSLFVQGSSPFSNTILNSHSMTISTLWMSVYSNVTEQDLNNLRKLAEQQKQQRALKIKNRILKQTLDIKLAESLSPITKKLDEVKETNQKLGEVIEKTQPENNKPQRANEHTPHHQPIEKKEGVIYDTELENTLKNMKSWVL